MNKNETAGKYRATRRTQAGIGLGVLLGVMVVLIVIGLVALKIAPSYIEYGQIKKAVAAIVASGEAKGSVGEVRKAFDRRAQVDEISSVSAQDLDVSKEGNEIVVAFAYSKKIPLFSNISLVIDFAGSSKQ
jgi:hypothetical protein